MDLRIAFCSTPTFAEHHPMIASNTKYETAIPNSAKWFSSYEKMKNNTFFLLKNTTYT